MKLLLLNWRDPWHPKAGGAETLTFRVLSRLVRRGWEVEWFSAAFPGCRTSEVREGITLIRRGAQWSVHVLAFFRYAYRNDFDVIVEQVNTLPFYAMAYRSRSVSWFQQLAREVWLLEAPPVLGRLGFLLEPLYLWPYRNQSTITISKSSRESLRDIGFKGAIEIIPMATDERVVPSVPYKSVDHTIVVVGRIARSKRIEESLFAAALLKDGGWQGRLRIVGSGSEQYLAELKTVVASLDLMKTVVFEGRVTSERRASILDDASVLWMTSVREGWGLVVTEAAAHGTPAVVYDVPGLRDSVQDRVTGLIVRQDAGALADATFEILRELPSYGERARLGAESMSWDLTAHAFERHLRAFLEAAS